MTKSQGFSAHRRAYIKSVRAKSHREGTLFKQTLENAAHTKDAVKARLTTDDLNPSEYRNIRRPWYSDALPIDDNEHDLGDEEEALDEFETDIHKRHPRDMSVQLLDIARPSRKRRDHTKDFELINSRHSGLGDEEFEIWEEYESELWEDDWEKIYDEQVIDTKRTYSSVLRGNER